MQLQIFLWWVAGFGNVFDVTENYFSIEFISNEAVSTELLDEMLNFNAAICECDLDLQGSETSGIYTLSECVFIANTISADPACNLLNETGVYTKTDLLLLLEPSGSFSYAFGESSIYY